MEHTDGNPSEDGSTVSPTAGNLGTPGCQGTAEEVAEDAVGTSDKEGPPDGAERQCEAASEGVESGQCPGEAMQGEASGEEGTTTMASQEDTGKKEEAKPEPSEVKGKEEAMLASKKQKADEKETNLESKEKLDVNDKAKPEPKEDAGAEVAVKEPENESQNKADVKDKATAERQEVDGKESEGDTKELVSGAQEGLRPSPLWNQNLPHSLFAWGFCC